MADVSQRHPSPNRLIHETSPYLKHHANNPVDWYPWGEEALTRAKAEDKPILLSIGYSACHWCHVMAEESFDNPDIAAVMNERFINIKVDREERPDLDDIYQKAAQAFLGRGGGWPLTVFLTPDQEPFYAGTYFPAVARYGMPGFPQVLLGVAEAYRDHPEQVKDNTRKIASVLRRISAPQPTDEALTEELLDEAAKDIEAFYEPIHGGFGHGPKFPMAAPFNLLLRQAYRQGDGALRDKVLSSLHRIAAGGIYDHLGGGFHRYAVDERWLVPHFEKMLYDNAQLVRLYLDGWRLTREPRFRQVVEETLGYIQREMTDPEGGFYASQDADSEGEEGKFFLWTPSEIKDLLGRETGELFCRLYDVTESGNFEGRTILNLLRTKGRLEAPEIPEVDRIMAGARARLFDARERRIKPFRDEKILTSWNGLMIAGALDAYQTFGRPEYLEMAEKALAFLLERACSNGRLVRTVTQGRGRLNAYLDDYAFLTAALLDAFEATSAPAYLEKARELTATVREQFWDDQTGGCFFTADDHEVLIQRMKSGHDSAIPSGNAVAAMNFLRLFHLTGEESYGTWGERTLRLFRAEMDRNAYGAASMLAALDFYLAKPQEIVVVADRSQPRTRELCATVFGRYLPNKTLVVTDGVESAALPPVARDKPSVDGHPTVYVCHRFTCSRPVTDAVNLGALL